MKTFKSILGKVCAAVLTEGVIKALILWGLRQVVKSSKNTVDDELLKIVEEALNSK